MFGFRTRTKLIEANHLLLVQQGVLAHKIEKLNAEKRGMQHTIERQNNVISNMRKRLLDAGLIDEPTKPIPEFLRRKPLDQQEKPPASVVSMPVRHVPSDAPMIDLNMSTPFSTLSSGAARDDATEPIVSGGGGSFGGGGATGSWESPSSSDSSSSSSDSSSSSSD